MVARTNAPTSPTASTAGVLRPEDFARHVHLERSSAGEPASRWIENHWSLQWELPPGTSYASQVVAHPTVSLTFEEASHRRPGLPPEPLIVTGVATRRFDVDVQGRGRVLGVRFRPAGLTAITGMSAAPWTDRSIAATGVLPPDVCERLSDPCLADDPEAWGREAERLVTLLAPPEDDRYDAVIGIVADMLADRSLVTVSAAARRHGVSVRTLQRMFVHYVGVGPKWVLARYRLHDAIADLDAGWDGTLTDLAHRYGWYDQAHFTRDFTAVVGIVPSEYTAPAR